MNVPVTPEGGLTFEDGISEPGKYVEMRAEMDVLAMISNCPQLNNPCNAYNPTPVQVLIWDPVRTDVPQSADRESRRDRLPHHPHAAKHGVATVAVYSEADRHSLHVRGRTRRC